MAHTIISASVKVRRAYVCRVCGVSAFGDVATIDVSEFFGNADHLADCIGRRADHLPAHYMPVGWASYGTHGFACSQHSV